MTEIQFSGNVKELVNSSKYRVRAYSESSYLNLTGTYVEVVAYDETVQLVTIKVGRRIMLIHLTNITFVIELIEENAAPADGQSFDLHKVNRIVSDDGDKKKKKKKKKL